MQQKTATTTHGTATFEHTATSGDTGYNNLTIDDVKATEKDKVSADITIEGVTPSSIAEGDSINYTVKLTTKPSGNVTVAITLDSYRPRKSICLYSGKYD